MIEQKEYMVKNKTLLSFYAFVILSNSGFVLSSTTEMAVLIGSQVGASIANEVTSAEFQDIGISLFTDQLNLRNNLDLFFNQITEAESNNAKLFDKIFSDAFNHISKQEEEQSQVSSVMQDYIWKSISIHEPQFYYLLTGATTFDQAFTNGTMYTPQDRTWKNIYGYGDWEYDYATDSFWQMQSVPTFIDQTDSKTGTPTKSSAEAAYNSIFTEYFTHENSYEIQCEITLYKIQYPFFVGILFNKTRWISGSADSLTKARLVGIYGSSQDNFGTYYSEQKQVSQKEKKSDSGAADQTIEYKTLYPLDQIIQKQIKQQSPLSKELFANLHLQPATFVVRIITSPKNVQFKIWQKSKKEPTDFITINNTQQDLYLYHGIGCMSPGAIAQFTLKKPQGILFSQETKKSFAQEVEALLAPLK